MALKAGIIGLPNVGKSTLFQALANCQVEIANYPFATIEPNVGVVKLPDERLEKIANIIKPCQITYSTFQFIDIAGLVKGAAQGEGLGNKFLAHIREVDAIIEVVRCFSDKKIIHINDRIDVIYDVTIINTELILADLGIIKKIVEQTLRQLQRSENKKTLFEHKIALQAQSHLEAEKPLRSLDLDQAAYKLLKMWNLLTIKPIIYVGNVNENDAANPLASHHFQTLKKYAKQKGTKAIALSAKLELELSLISEGSEKIKFLNELGLAMPILTKLVKVAFATLGLATFFTAGKKEVRSWTFKKGSLAPECGGIIHTDFERGFIKAKVIAYDDYIAYQGNLAATQAGKNRLEGKKYVVQDGDIIEFKFNV